MNIEIGDEVFIWYGSNHVLILYRMLLFISLLRFRGDDLYCPYVVLKIEYSVCLSLYLPHERNAAPLRTFRTLFFGFISQTQTLIRKINHSDVI